MSIPKAPLRYGLVIPKALRYAYGCYIKGSEVWMLYHAERSRLAVAAFAGENNLVSLLAG